MAVARNPNYCYICGELIKERHINMGKHFCGDTFIGYESHVCNHTTEKFKEWTAKREAYRNSPEGEKETADIKKMWEGIKVQAEARKTYRDVSAKKDTQMDNLNEFLREIADNGKVGIRRKLVAIKRYIKNLDGSINK